MIVVAHTPLEGFSHHQIQRLRLALLSSCVASQLRFAGFRQSAGAPPQPTLGYGSLWDGVD